MSNGTFQDFLDAMRAFESGWDSARYATGNIIDAQLNEWAGGVVTDFYPNLTSWGDMTDAQWDEMSYRSENSLGFVGYQFGEALLIDLGYYEADTFYGNGAATNAWEGTWTGKNGVTSLEEFKTEAAQEIAIREAFGFNLKIIEDGLANSGRSLDEFIGTTLTYVDQGIEVPVTITMTGLLSAAHLRGAYGTLNLLLSDSVSFDENGTSILTYIERFGGFASPTAEEIIATYNDSASNGGSGSGSAGVTAETADVVITWAYGADINITDFDPETGTIFVGWIGADDLVVTEVNGSTVFSIASNLQQLTLDGVTLDALSAANFTFLDASAEQEVLALIGTDEDDTNTGGDDNGDDNGDDDTGDDSGNGEDDDTGDNSDDNSSDDDETGDNSDGGSNEDDTGGTSDGTSGNGTAGVTAATADVVVTWAYGIDDVVSDFDPATDTIFVDWIPAGALEIQETEVGVVISVPGNAQTTALFGITLADLTPANFTILDDSAAQEILSMISEGDSDGHDDGDTGHDDDAGHGDDGTGHHDDMGHTHMHVSINLDTPAQTIDGFMPAMGDVIELENDVYAENFAIFEESGEALGQTVRIEINDGSATKQIILTGIGLNDLDIGNFSIANEGVLNEVASALGSVITMPDGGEILSPVYDSDGSNPVESTGASPQGGTKFKSDSNADDIVGFDPAADALDFGGTSVHGMIVTKMDTGEIVIDSPWSDAAQIVQGVTYQDVTLDNFGVVGNEHLRQDIGGVLSWEQGVGPRDADTVYVRSHEYGVHETVDGFDPATMKISFLYFGTRERLNVQDTDEGLVISSLPTGQSLTLSGVELADLIPGLLEFHHDQVMEDNLEDPFGFAQDDVSLVSRAQLLTPTAPDGATTDGDQVRVGKLDNDAPDGGETPEDANPDVLEITWDWGAEEIISDFDVATDSFHFGALSSTQVDVAEVADDLVIRVLDNGGHSYTILGLQAEDLSLEQLTANDNSSLLDEDGAFIASFADLGLDVG
ncbi:MAG: hypothetical protein ABJ360_04535 [Roseobacter sp.]